MITIARKPWDRPAYEESELLPDSVDFILTENSGIRGAVVEFVLQLLTEEQTSFASMFVRVFQQQIHTDPNFPSYLPNSLHVAKRRCMHRPEQSYATLDTQQKTKNGQNVRIFIKEMQLAGAKIQIGGRKIRVSFA